jgi:hypothetical protein
MKTLVQDLGLEEAEKQAMAHVHNAPPVMSQVAKFEARYGKDWRNRGTSDKGTGKQ